jgi:hypothetical protein
VRAVDVWQAAHRPTFLTVAPPSLILWQTTASRYPIGRELCDSTSNDHGPTRHR